MIIASGYIISGYDTWVRRYDGTRQFVNIDGAERPERRQRTQGLCSKSFDLRKALLRKALRTALRMDLRMALRVVLRKVIQ